MASEGPPHAVPCITFCITPCTTRRSCVPGPGMVEWMQVDKEWVMDDARTTTITLSLPSAFGYEALAREMLAWVGAHGGLDASRLADVQTAVCEACINAIEHGNEGRP